MYEAIRELIPKDRDFPERTWHLDVLRRALYGRLYDVLEYHFHQEWLDSGEYVPIVKRRPSVRYNLCRTVVEDAGSLLFGEGRFPSLFTEHAETRDALAGMVKESAFVSLMEEAAFKGSVGSVAILFRVLRDRPFFSVMETHYLTPEWLPEAPDTLQSVTEKYKVRGAALREQGYTVADEDVQRWYWFMRTWDAAYEKWFEPWPVELLKNEMQRPLSVDKNRTVQHDLGFVPIVWIRNLPGGNQIDGLCTFESALATQVEIEYQLSQADRALRYSADPLLMIREPAGSDDRNLVRSSSNALIVDKDGDAKMLEIDGRAAGAVVDFCRTLREYALETIHGNRANADRLTAAQSGRAIELLHQALVWLADKMRDSYGERGLLPLVAMVIKASMKTPLLIRGKRVTMTDEEGVTLRWKGWFPPTETDRQIQSATLQVHRQAGHISRETAVDTLAANYDIEDPKAEITRILADEQEADQRLIAVEKATVTATAVVDG